jgi:hypothetical protein
MYAQRGRSLEETIGEDITRKKNTLLKKGKKHKKGWGDKTYTNRRTPSTFFFSLLSLPPNLHKGRAPSSSPFFFWFGIPEGGHPSLSFSLVVSFSPSSLLKEYNKGGAF